MRNLKKVASHLAAAFVEHDADAGSEVEGTDGAFGHWNADALFGSEGGVDFVG